MFRCTFSLLHFTLLYYILPYSALLYPAHLYPSIRYPTLLYISNVGHEWLEPPLKSIPSVLSCVSFQATRAKHSLFILGNADTLQGVPIWSQLIKVRKRGWCSVFSYEVPRVHPPDLVDGSSSSSSGSRSSESRVNSE